MDDSGFLILITLVSAPVLWVIAVLIVGVLLGTFFGLGSIFWFGPLEVLSGFTISNRDSDATSKNWAPLFIWGGLGVLAIFNYFGFGKTAALTFIVVYCGIGLLWPLLRPRPALHMMLGTGVAFFGLSVMLLHYWARGLSSTADWLSKRVESACLDAEL